MGGGGGKNKALMDDAQIIRNICSERLCSLMVDKQIRITPEIVKELFEEVCKATLTRGAVLNQADIDLTVFGVNKEKDVFNQAAVAMYRIASSHPFSDGNKRTAVLLAELILNQRGFKLKANPDVATKLLLKIASGKEDLDEVKEWVKKHAARL